MLAPESTIVLLPDLVRPNPTPLITPPTVSVPVPLVETLRVAGSATAPVPRFRLLVPPKKKSPFQFCTLFADSVTGTPLELSMNVFAAMFSAPVPMAAALLMFNVPDVTVVPPA